MAEESKANIKATMAIIPEVEKMEQHFTTYSARASKSTSKKHTRGGLILIILLINNYFNQTKTF
jgi:hypothetical protein